MIVTVRRLLKGRPKPICVGRQATLKVALKLMIDKDFSQLPVVDEQDELVGMLSEQSISRTLFHKESRSSQRREVVPLLSLAVDQCMDRPATLTEDADLLEALEQLSDHYALVVVAGKRVVDIVTDFDIAHFLHDL